MGHGPVPVHRARGLSRTMATSISPQSFLMIGKRPVCICCKTAKAWFSQIFLSHSSLALNAREAVCGGALLMLRSLVLAERCFSAVVPQACQLLTLLRATGHCL